jgi:hypothetical protein
MVYHIESTRLLPKAINFGNKTRTIDLEEVKREGEGALLGAEPPQRL